MPTITLNSTGVANALKAESEEYIDYDDTIFAPGVTYMPASSSEQQYRMDRVMARMYPDIELFVDFHSTSGKYMTNPRNDVLPANVGGEWPFQTVIKPDYRAELACVDEQHRLARRRYERRLEQLEDRKHNMYARLAEAERVATVMRCGGIMPRSYNRPSVKMAWARAQFQNRAAATRGILTRFPVLKEIMYASRRGEDIPLLDEYEPAQVNDIVLGCAELYTLGKEFTWTHALRSLMRALFGSARCIDHANCFLHGAPEGRMNAIIERVTAMMAEKNPELAMIHKLQDSAEKEGMVCYFDSGYKAMKNCKTRTTLGRYLTRFLPDLPQTEVKRLADAYSVATKPANMQLIPNTAPDAWVWAYENGPVSCMTYNRDCRYINSGLGGRKHPVRAYAYSGNDLALAVLMPDGIDALDMAATSPNQNDTEMVLARAIVNVEQNGWLRIYAQSDAHRDQLITELKRNGFRANSGCLDGQELAIVYSDEDGFTCPYLDGDYTSVSHRGNYLRVCDDGDYDGQNSTGWVESCIRELCSHCGDRHVNSDDDAYVDGVGVVCGHCLDHYYTYAYVNRHEQDYIPDNQAICVDGEYYLNDASVLSSHDIEECAVSGEYYSTSDMIAMDHGEHEGAWVHESEAFLLPNDLGYCTNEEADSILAKLGIDEDGNPVEEAA